MGQSQTKSFPDEIKAKREAENLIAEKVKKGVRGEDWINGQLKFMQLPADLVYQAFMFGLVIGSIAIAWLIGAALGGWQFGDFLRCIEIITAQAQLPHFNERLQRRLAELGFTATGNPGEFQQGGAHFEEVGAFTHAKTPKLLTFTLDPSNPSEIKIQLALR